MANPTKSKRRMIHCIAHCKNCDWQEEWYLTAGRRAAKHAKDYGHSVAVEQGIHYDVTGEPVAPFYSEEDRKAQEQGVVTTSIFEEIQEQCVSPDRCQGNCTGACQLYNHNVDINDL